MRVSSIKGISQADLRGKCVLVRIYLGASLNGNAITDDKKINGSLETLAYLMNAGARVIVATHIGTYDHGQRKALRLDEVIKHLSSQLVGPIKTLEGWDAEAVHRAVRRLNNGELLVLENLSCMPGEEVNAPEFAELLAGLCDIYCNDAFALAHEIRASTVGVARRAKQSVVGIDFERELSLLSQTLDGPARPLLTILGGKLSEDRLAMVETIARQSQVLLLGGELCLPFLIARGINIGRVEVDRDLVTFAEYILSAAKKDRREIDLPIDFTTIEARELEQIRQGRRFVPGPNISVTPAGEMRHDLIICDIGETTRWAWSGRFGFARTIFWHGPLGICEIKPFDEGTRFIAEELANRTWPGMHKAVLAGGSLTATLRQMGQVIERLPGLSFADRAALHYFARHSLPAIDALEQSATKADEPFRILIPLGGSKSDANALRVGTQFGMPSAEITLLHVRPGFDEEQFPDFAAAMSESDRAEGRSQSERLFSRANAALALGGVTASNEMVAQGNWADMILRCAGRLGTNLIVLPANGVGLITGSQQVIDQAPCGVIVAK
jgi:phosphoglycerate kinase